MIEREAYSEAAIARRLTRLLMAILLAFGAIGLALSYWSVVRTMALAVRPDNPRLVEAEFRVQRGRILDRNNVILAENAGPTNAQVREYPIAESGPAVGHYSLRYGATGIEASYNELLRGDDRPTAERALDDLLNIPPTGRHIRLTLDATLQQGAARLMAGQQGALVLLELTDEPAAEVRAMVSQPWYDPAELDALFESLETDDDISLFNRATQGQYQPGLVLLPLLTAAAIDVDVIDPSATVDNATRSVGIDGHTQGCLAPADEPLTWLAATQSLCPGAAADLGELLDADGLTRALQQFGLYSRPVLPIPTADVVAPAVSDITQAALGQAELTVSPLQVALAYGALTSGQLAPPRLVEAVQSPGGGWKPVALEDASTMPVLRPATTALMRATLSESDDISGLSVPVLSAPGGQVNQWYVGLAPSGDPRFVVVVVLEQPADPALAETIGQMVLTQALLQP
jgi:peptidoglycan glycosyltransferase